MSWSFSPGLVAAFSEACCSDTDASAQSNTTPTPDQFYWPDKPTEHSRLSRFGMTSAPLTGDRGAALLTWFREAFLARTSAPLEGATAWRANAPGSGRKWLGLLARYDRDSRSWRTPQCSLVEGLDEFSETWPRWGSMRTGESWERTTAALPTSASESGFWPTPTVCGNYNRPGASATSGMGLASAVKLWPTPQASDNRNRGTTATPAIARRIDAGKQVMLSMCMDGPLNPDWVEWLMGWPIGHTDLRPLATGRFLEFVQQHGKS